LDWTLNAAGHRYQSLLAEWTTITNGATGVGGEFDFRGFHGSYDITITPPGGQPTLRRIVLDPGADTNVVTLIAHSSGTKPLLHNPALQSANGPFEFQLTGDAGKIFAIQSSTNLGNTNWTTITNFSNPYGTIWITNPAAVLSEKEFFRAKLLP
jgi:hypothetical protein